MSIPSLYQGRGELDWLTLIVAAIAALSPILVVIIGRRAAKKVEEIHVLVNSRLDAALRQVDLREQALKDKKEE